MDSLWFIPSGMRVGDPSEDMIGAVCEFVEVTERFPDGSPKSGVCQVKRWTDLPGGLEMEDVDRALGVTTVGPLIHIQDQHD